jgi:hypothetical protein
MRDHAATTQRTLDYKSNLFTSFCEVTKPLGATLWVDKTAFPISEYNICSLNIAFYYSHKNIIMTVTNNC